VFDYGRREQDFKGVLSMKKRFLAGIVLCALLLSVWTVGISKGFAAQVFVNPTAPMVQTRVRASESFRDMLEKNPEVQALVVKSIAKAAEINPDRVTNPAQSLDELYSFLDYTVTCMPWNILQEEKYDSFATKCDQSIL
jgi:hypothetical protein